jgi:hypothetical protein
VILRSKSPNHSYRFWGPNRETLHHIDFEAKLEKTVTTGFEAKPLETVTNGFEAKQVKTVTIGLEAKPAKTVWVVLRPSHSQTVTLDFKARPRNPRS